MWHVRADCSNATLSQDLFYQIRSRRKQSIRECTSAAADGSTQDPLPDSEKRTLWQIPVAAIYKIGAPIIYLPIVSVIQQMTDLDSAKEREQTGPRGPSLLWATDVVGRGSESRPLVM